MRGDVLYINYAVAIDFLLPRHYSGRVPQISVAFGWFIDKKLVAVCTFGKPASNSLCEGLMGKEFSSSVYELNRLCRIESLNDPLSCFVSACLRRLRVNNWVIVSYADTEMLHHGYIYQACNFLYTGMTKARTDKYTEGNKHSRHYTKEENSHLRKIRSSKHRYIFFCTYDKKLKKIWRNSLKYKTYPYPKGDNQNYILGEFLKPRIISN